LIPKPGENPHGFMIYRLTRAGEALLKEYGDAQDSIEDAMPGDAANGSSPGAGILIQTKDGRVLFLKRSPDEDNPGEWCLPGGASDGDEDPGTTAIRETREETGWTPEDKKPVKLAVIKEWQYTVFKVAVNSEFIPTLSDESVGYAWAPLDDPPQPLLSGLADFLENPGALDRSPAQDGPSNVANAGICHLGSKGPGTQPACGQRRAHMTFGKEEFRTIPEGERCKRCNEKLEKWDRIKVQNKSTPEEPVPSAPKKKPKIPSSWNKRLGLLKEPGQDARPDRMSFDRKSVRFIDHDGQMQVEITNISKANVCPYVGNEIPDYEKLGLDPEKMYQLYRDPQELAKATDSFDGRFLLDEHIPVYGENYAEKVQSHIIGTVLAPVFEAPYLKASLIIASPDAQEAIRSGEQKELSCGYHYRADMTPGVAEGKPYDGIMRDIVGNHVALVKEGRAGPDVCVNDSQENLAWASVERAFSTFIGPKFYLKEK
jgi:8-oxo-dGTP pyrophosphatase MutT (NUDIX family)